MDVLQPKSFHWSSCCISLVLCSWKVFIFFTPSNRFSFRLPCSQLKLGLHQLRTAFPVPADGKYPHRLMLPPPRFPMGTTCSGGRLVWPEHFLPHICCGPFMVWLKTWFLMFFLFASPSPTNIWGLDRTAVFIVEWNYTQVDSVYKTMWLKKVISCTFDLGYQSITLFRVSVFVMCKKKTLWRALPST